jgi:hypothetical protein
VPAPHPDWVTETVPSAVAARGAAAS